MPTVLPQFIQEGTRARSQQVGYFFYSRQYQSVSAPAH